MAPGPPVGLSQVRPTNYSGTHNLLRQATNGVPVVTHPPLTVKWAAEVPSAAGMSGLAGRKNQLETGQMNKVGSQSGTSPLGLLS